MTTLHENLTKLWPLVNQSKNKTMPKLPDSALEAFSSFLEAIEDEQFMILPPSTDRYSYLRLMLDVGDNLEVTVPICELVRFCTPWWSETSFYIDTIADTYGKHRVYVRDEQTSEGLPWGAFGSIEDTVKCLLDHAASPEATSVWTSLDDDWEQGLLSGSFLLESFLMQDLMSLWRQAVEKKWPSTGEDSYIELDLTDRTPGWQRRLCWMVLKNFVETREVVVTPESMKGLSPAQKAFIGHLTDLEDFLDAQQTPKVVAQVSNMPEHPLTEKAANWIRLHGGEVEERVESQPDAFAAQLRPMLEKIVSDLEKKELLELEAQCLEPLLEELTESASRAKHPKALLKAILYALIHSENVIEIYGTDNELLTQITRSVSA